MSSARATRSSSSAVERERKRARTEGGDGSCETVGEARTLDEESTMSEASSSADEDASIAQLLAKPNARPRRVSADVANDDNVEPPTSSPPRESPPASSSVSTDHVRNGIADGAKVADPAPPSISAATTLAAAALPAADAALPAAAAALPAAAAALPAAAAASAAAAPAAESVKSRSTLSLTFPEWVTDAVQGRLIDMMDFSDPSSKRFGVAHVPAEGHWGRVVNGIDNSRFFCIDDDPLTVWLTGTLHSLWFQDKRGILQERASIGLSLFRTEDVDAAAKLLALSEPVKAPKRDVFYVGRFMSERVKGKSAPVIKMFEEIYDAKRPGMRRADLPRKMHYDLGEGDVLLVEAALIRYKIGDTRKDWDTCQWNTSFELKSISIIAEVPVTEATSTPSLHPDERIL